MENAGNINNEAERTDVPEWFYQCKTEEEYREKRIQYIELSVIAKIDQKKLLEDNLAYYRNELGEERVNKIDQFIKDWTIIINYYSPSSFDLANNKEFDATLKSFIDKWYVHKVEWYQDVYITINPKVEWWEGMLLTPYATWSAVSARFEIPTSYKTRYWKTHQWIVRDDVRYVRALALKKYMDDTGKPRLVFNTPPRPLPPQTFLPQQIQEMNAKMDAEIERRSVVDLARFSIDEIKKEIERKKSLTTAVPATKSTRVVNDKGYEEFYVWDEKVSKDVHDLYVKFKKDHMIPGGKDNEFLPKDGIYGKYIDISWSFFKNFVLNRDTEYTDL